MERQREYNDSVSKNLDRKILKNEQHCSIQKAPILTLSYLFCSDFNPV